MEKVARPRNDLLGGLVLGTVTVVWASLLILLPRGDYDQAAQLVSNAGLIAIAFAAGLAALMRARGGAPQQRFWLLLGLASLSWSVGQVVWSVYESLLGREVPFPSLADIGYLGFPPLAAGALLCLPFAASTLAGRLRTLLDGLMIAASLLLVSWVLVLAPVVEAGADSLFTQAISLAYPVGDTVVITIVIYTWLRARQSGNSLPVSLPLVGSGLVAFAVADSGFVYLTTSGAYSSGSLIDIGWFVGFAVLLLAAVAQAPSDVDEVVEVGPARQFGAFLPYTAVTLALVTWAVVFVRDGTTDAFVSWDRSALMAFLVARQVLTLRENWALTRHLEQRVDARTAELESSRERFAALVQHSSDVVTVIDADGLILYQSQSCARVLHRTAESMSGRPVWEFMAGDQAVTLHEAIAYASEESLRMHTLHTVWRREDGSPCHLEVTITNLLDNDDVAGLVLNSRDVTDRTVLQEQLLHQAFHDSLTTLSNRAMFKDRLGHALTRRDLQPGSLAVLFLDLDGFKQVNDTLGHSIGDELLVQVAQRLHTQVRPNDTVARFGGDEFAILVEDLTDPGFTITLAERVNVVLKAPYQLGGQPVHVSASVGIAHFGEHAADAEQLLRNADLAMYQAKAAATGGYALYDPRMHEGLVERVRLETDLRVALETEGLAVDYQPLIDLRTGKVTGVEALCRWPHAELGLISPDEFIPLAESSGLIRVLGEWVLRRSCQQVVQWRRQTPELSELKVSVNVSARQLHDGDLARTVTTVLEETGLPAQCLTLEMTESVLMNDSGETLSTLRAIRAMGVRLAIDDFGTGYSSLSYLHRFPVDVLKIDRSFIERLTHAGDAALVSTIVRLGHAMDLETVAEGIERPDEMLMLRRQGCTTGQGFYFSRPLPADELHAHLIERAQTNFLLDTKTPV